MQSLRTEAWLLRGISSIPGELVLRGGVLSFSARSTGSAWPWQLRKLERSLGAPGFAGALEKGYRRTLFQWPVRSVRFWVPWYYFGGGIKVSRDGLVLRLSFGRPANTRASNLASAFANLKEVAVMRRRGKLWLAALESAAGGK
ncbi:MAG TPA: hypothetical protein PKA20_00855 [Burkholderiaceae bacterium]|nr:hypothetical protein [Burkholderiaceae bacterium]